MQAFRVGHSRHDDWRAALAAALDEIGTVPPEANFGMVYVTDRFAGALGEIRDALERRTGVLTWIGTTGIGVCATGVEYFDQPAIAVMIGSVPDGSARLIDTGTAAPEAALGRLAADIGCKDGRFAILHADPRNPHLQELLPAIADTTGAFLVGGLTSSRGAHPQVAGGSVSGGVSGLVLEPDVSVATGLTQGCSPIGPAHEVTAAEDNFVIELDGRPAFDVFVEDIGEVLARSLDRVGGYIFAAFPVSGLDRPDYLVRNLVGIDRGNGILAIGALVAEGDRLLFCRRDGQAAHLDLQRMLADLVRRLDGRTPRGGVYHTCLARGPNLFGPGSVELRTIRDTLGDVPLVGMFCNGEISHRRLYGYTGVLSLFL
jgi:small ligand-binding sensory domain FIST